MEFDKLVSEKNWKIKALENQIDEMRDHEAYIMRINKQLHSKVERLKKQLADLQAENRDLRKLHLD